MKKHFLIFAALVLSSFLFTKSSYGQAMGHEYGTGVGVKIGSLNGGAIDVKHFFQPDRALEGMLSFGNHSFVITGLYEFHGPIGGAPGLKWYIGPGAHLGAWSTDSKHSGIFLGIDGVVGLDYKFNNAPIDVSLDLQPSINIPKGGFNAWGGLGIRYAF